MLDKYVILELTFLSRGREKPSSCKYLKKKSGATYVFSSSFAKEPTKSYLTYKKTPRTMG